MSKLETRIEELELRAQAWNPRPLLALVQACLPNEDGSSAPRPAIPPDGLVSFWGPAGNRLAGLLRDLLMAMEVC
jgi:hypothetical protein